MEPEIRLTLGVYRRLDNRLEGKSDDSPRALELHQRRRAALHEVFEGKALTVLAWGDTDDERAHECVELMVGAAVSAVVSYAVVPGLKFLGEKLVEAAADHATSEAVKAVVSWLRPAVPTENTVRIARIEIAGVLR